MSDEDAIQEDVSEEVSEEQKVDDRLDFMEQLAERNHEERQDAAQDEEVVDEELEEIVEEEDTPQLVRVKVEGQEMELPIDEVVKGYQKDATASQRLEQAHRERQELEQLRQQLEEEKARFEQAQEKPVEEDQPSTDAEEARRIYESLQDAFEVGDQEEGVKAIEELLNGRTNAIPEQVDKDQIVNEATQHALQQIQYENAHQAFLSENEVIANDPVLYQMTMNVLKETVPLSQTYHEAFAKAGENVKQWVSGLQKPQETTDKLERKKNMAKEPSKAGSVATPRPEEKPETRADIIANMRKERGQPV